MGITVAAILLCGGTLTFVALGQFQKGQQRTAQGAIIEYFDAVQFRDKDRLSDVLCSDENVDAHINGFHRRLDEANFELQTLSWIPSEPVPDSGSRHTVEGIANITATRSNKNFDVKIGYQISVERKYFTWYICEAKQTS